MIISVQHKEDFDFVGMFPFSKAKTIDTIFCLSSEYSRSRLGRIYHVCRTEAIGLEIKENPRRRKHAIKFGQRYSGTASK